MTTPVNPGSAEGPPAPPPESGEGPAGGPAPGAGEAGPGGAPAAPTASGGNWFTSFIETILRPFRSLGGRRDV
jgi:hypothetical protein